jgi:hypothetical protein
VLLRRGVVQLDGTLDAHRPHDPRGTHHEDPHPRSPVVSQAESLDALARAVFTIALRDNRAGELLWCLFNNGSCVVDAFTGELILISNEALGQIK